MPDLEGNPPRGRGVVLDRDLFHVSPVDFAPGDRLVPGVVVGRVTTRESRGAEVYLAGSLEDARTWARYVGERSRAVRVGIYRVRPDAEPVAAAPRRGVPQAATFEVGAAVVLGCLGWVDPWEGRPDGYREALATVPF